MRYVSKFIFCAEFYVGERAANTKTRKERFFRFNLSGKYAREAFSWWVAYLIKWNPMKIKLLVIISLCCIFFDASAQSGSAIKVTVSAANGTYVVSTPLLKGAFIGRIGARLHGLKYLNGKDGIGPYRMISFAWEQDLSYTGSIRWYSNSPVIIFSWTVPDGSGGQRPVKFPQFTGIPRLPYHFSYHNHIFPLPEFYLEETSTPWLLFNEDLDACVISPASDFMVSLMTNDDSTTLTSGLNPEVKNLPAGFTHSTIMVLDRGIRRSWDDWGNALRSLYKKKRPENDCDPLLKYYGFWTDNGSDYYYSYDTTMGYQGTLLAVGAYYKKRSIPLGYMQLDSWWYEKSRYNVYGRLGKDKKIQNLPSGLWNRSGGLLEYKADPFLFPHGLDSFHRALGLPLVTHNRWIDSTSPYHKRYKMSGISAVDTAFWLHIMRYLKQSGVAVYEQDWMNYMYRLNPAMISDVSIGNAFTDGMAKAAKKYGIDIQYCMALPRYYMQAVKYDNVTTIRPSGDRFKPERWKNFIFASQLAYEMGIWPWCDVFKSNETANMIVSVLSAGAVGTGDAIGTEDKANILKACRGDGVLVKPDVPLLPMDLDYLHMAKGSRDPHLAYTYTRHQNIVTGYVFAYADAATTDCGFAFFPAEIGIQGKSVVYNPQNHRLWPLRSGGVFHDSLPAVNYAYYIVAPLVNGIAFFGDRGKIAATGKKRIAQLVKTENGLKIKVLFGKGDEAVTLQGYAPRNVVADKGIIKRDSTTGLFDLVLPAPSAANSVTVTLNSE